MTAFRTDWGTISFDDRMATSEFRIHERAHIVVDGDACRGCSRTRPAL